MKKENFENYLESCTGVGKHWGDMMPMMAMEEAAEFAQAVSKLSRIETKINKCREVDADDIEDYIEARHHLIEEIGDLYISLRALQSNWLIPESVVWRRIDEKLSKKY